jgi:predicted O-linked N-acetylglucosamine transferase (SPINDLY family)
MFPDAKLQSANLLLSRQQFSQAVAAYDEFLASSPDSGEAWHNRGIALAQLKQFRPAALSFARALNLRPDSAASWHNRGLALAELGQFDHAVRDHARALAIKPDLPLLFGDLLLAKLNACDWQDVRPARRVISDQLTRGFPAIAPFGNLLISESPADQLQCARIWMQQHVRSAPPPWRSEGYTHERIRVAYVSGDFRSHPVGGLVVSLFEQQDRRKFECFGLSFGPDDGSTIRRRVTGALEHFIDARQRSDHEIAEIMREAQIDIAIDLMGITADCRPGIFATRPAPVQVAYLGFPGTLGASFIDYIIADRVVLPVEHQAFFAEKIAWLPNCYLPGGGQSPPGACTRALAGLPDAGFVFCSFNNNFKILPETFACWMAILGSVDDSVLWLAEPNPIARTNLTREAERYGIASGRLIFAPHVPAFDDHLKRLAAADLFLDTWPFNAHSTAIDALNAGIPVLSYAGFGMAGRAGASLLAAAGLSDLIAHSAQQYQGIAIELARNPTQLLALKGQLLQSRQSAPLFDSTGFARQFESALAEMHARQKAGQQPASFIAGTCH